MDKKLYYKAAMTNDYCFHVSFEDLLWLIIIIVIIVDHVIENTTISYKVKESAFYQQAFFLQCSTHNNK